MGINLLPAKVVSLAKINVMLEAPCPGLGAIL